MADQSGVNTPLSTDGSTGINIHAAPSPAATSTAGTASPTAAHQQQPMQQQPAASAVPPQQQQLNAQLVQQTVAMQQRIDQLTAQLQNTTVRARELKLPEPRYFRGTRDRTPV